MVSMDEFKRGDKYYQCPECEEKRRTPEELRAHIVRDHKALWDRLVYEEVQRRKEAARARARALPEGSTEIARLLHLNNFTAAALIRWVMSQNVSPDQVDWHAYGMADWKKQMDRDEYVNSIKTNVQQDYGISVEGLDEQYGRAKEEFKEQLVVALMELMQQEIDGDNEKYLNDHVDIVIEMAKQEDRLAQWFLNQYRRDIMPHKYTPEMEAPKKSRMSRAARNRLVGYIKQTPTQQLRNMIEKREGHGKAIDGRRAIGMELEYRRRMEKPELRVEFESFKANVGRMSITELQMLAAETLPDWQLELIQEAVDLKQGGPATGGLKVPKGAMTVEGITPGRPSGPVGFAERLPAEAASQALKDWRVKIRMVQCPFDGTAFHTVDPGTIELLSDLIPLPREYWTACPFDRRKRFGRGSMAAELNFYKNELYPQQRVIIEKVLKAIEPYEQAEAGAQLDEVQLTKFAMEMNRRMSMILDAGWIRTWNMVRLAGDFKPENLLLVPGVQEQTLTVLRGLIDQMRYRAPRADPETRKYDITAIELFKVAGVEILRRGLFPAIMQVDGLYDGALHIFRNTQMELAKYGRLDKFIAFPSENKLMESMRYVLP